MQITWAPLDAVEVRTESRREYLWLIFTNGGSTIEFSLERENITEFISQVREALEPFAKEKTDGDVHAVSISASE